MENAEYYEGLYNIIMKQYNGDATWSDVVKYREDHGVKTTYDYVQRGCAVLMELLRAGYCLRSPDTTSIQSEGVAQNQEIAYNNTDNTYIYTKLIAIAKLEDITPESMIMAHGLDASKWECVTYKNNYWTTGNKGTAYYQSKLIVKPKNANALTLADVDAYFSTPHPQWNTKTPPTETFVQTDDTDEYLEIDYADPHIGLLSWAPEIGPNHNYDIHVATQRFLMAFDDIINRCRGRKFKLINFVTLGDIMHIDNLSNTTTKGTPQDTDGRATKIFDAALDVMITVIDKLLSLNSPVKYTYTQGNHDTLTGYILAKSLQTIYRQDTRITFDIEPNPQKAVVYGATLVGLTHGDMKKKNLAEWLQRDYRSAYGQCRFAEVHCGHLHEHTVEQSAGVTIRHLPTICESSLWEHHEGYSSQKAVMCYVYHESQGLRETWNTYVGG